MTVAVTRANRGSLSADFNGDIKRVSLTGYKQFTREQRYQIYALKKEGHSRTAIARNLGLHQATISRELSRHHGGRVARPKQADASAEAIQRRLSPRFPCHFKSPPAVS